MKYKFMTGSMLKRTTRAWPYVQGLIASIFGASSQILIVFGLIFFWLNSVMLVSEMVDKMKKEFTGVEKKTNLCQITKYEMMGKKLFSGKEGSMAIYDKKNFDLASAHVERQMGLTQIVNNSMQLDVIKKALLNSHQATLLPYVVQNDLEGVVTSGKKQSKIDPAYPGIQVSEVVEDELKVKTSQESQLIAE